MPKIKKELIDEVIYKLYRRANIHQPVSFEKLTKKIDPKELFKILKYLRNEGIVGMKLSNTSSKGRWKLNPKAKHIWEPIVFRYLTRLVKERDVS